MTSLQKKVADFNQSGSLRVDNNLRVLDLSSEVGEICKLAFSEGMGKVIAPSEWQGELGDALYSLLSLMTDMGIDAELALSLTLEKYRTRLAKTNSMDSSL